MSNARVLLLIASLCLVLLIGAACATGISESGIDAGEVSPGESVINDQSGETGETPVQPQIANQNETNENSAETAAQPEHTPPAQSAQNTPPGTEAAPATAGTPGNQQDSTPSNQHDNEASPQTSPPETPPSTPPSQEPPAKQPEPAPPDDGPIALTILGDGVSSETTWTLGRLQSMSEGYRENTYSTTNNWPSYGHTSAHGISLPYLLQQAGLLSSAASFKFTAADGYNFTVAYSQVFDTLLSYANHRPAGSSGASAVEPVVAWEWGDIGNVRQENLRVFFGHNGPWEVNTSAFVAGLVQIEVLSAPQGAWAAPDTSIADGSIVNAGAELSFLHDSMDSIRIYYTLDGSEPDYSSPVYNRSTSYFQPDLILPLILTESVTLKAFAAGLGKDVSSIVTFSFMVEET